MEHQFIKKMQVLPGTADLCPRHIAPGKFDGIILVL